MAREKTHKTGLDRAKSARGGEKETERQRDRQTDRQTETRPGYAAESGSCFIFHHSLYSLSWYNSKGQINTHLSLTLH